MELISTIWSWVWKIAGSIMLIYIAGKVEDSIIDFVSMIRRIENYLKRIANKLDPDGDMEKWVADIEAMEKKSPDKKTTK
jgi:hypothetical protein